MKIVVADADYVGLSNGILLAKKCSHLVDIDPCRIELLNKGESPIEDQEVKSSLRNSSLNFQATLDKQASYKYADYVIIATPTDYDVHTNSSNTESIEEVIRDKSSCFYGCDK